MKPRITIGISVYNDHEHLHMLLQSIHWYTHLNEPYQVYVCDDGSRPEVLVQIREVCRNFGAALMEHTQDGQPKNLGIPAAWNHLTLANPDAEIVVLLNDDILVVPNWLRMAVHFLDANKDNPYVGSCFWNPVNRTSKGMMREMLPHLGHTVYVSHDMLSGKELGAFDQFGHTAAKVGDGQGLGRVMCPCGCCFAFRMQVFKMAGPFDERLTSFHEESHFGTCCAAIGRASFGFAYPRPYHVHGQTFANNPELKADKRMQDSRRLYREFWQVPTNVPDDKYFDHVNQRLMTQIPQTTLKYLSPDYSAEPDMFIMPGGEHVALPHLVEKEGEF